jgi:hypothetical protein
MHSRSCSAAIALVVAAFWSPMTASAADASTADRSAGPTVAYESAFKDYRRYADEPVTSWTSSNDVVGKIGGWRAYARESGASRSGPSTTTPPTVAPSPAGTHSPTHRVPPSP